MIVNLLNNFFLHYKIIFCSQEHMRLLSTPHLSPTTSLSLPILFYSLFLELIIYFLAFFPQYILYFIHTCVYIYIFFFIIYFTLSFLFFICVLLQQGEGDIINNYNKQHSNAQELMLPRFCMCFTLSLFLSFFLTTYNIKISKKERKKRKTSTFV